jgi:hypothetical protein
LEGVAVEEGDLQVAQVLRRSQPLDGGDLIALVHHRQRQTRVDAHAVHQHRAGAALAVVAALFRALQIEVLAERVEQGGAEIKLERANRAIDGEADRCGVRRCRGSHAFGCLLKAAANLAALA